MDLNDGFDEYNNFLKVHGAQLRASVVPDCFWYTLFHKLRKEVFDAGDCFLMAKLVESEMDTTVVMTLEDGMDHKDCQHIYLVDHAWTFQARDAYQQLKTLPQLLARVSKLVGLGERTGVDLADKVYNVMWKFMRTYSRFVGEEEPPVTLWYLLDEFGSSIKHSSNPNFRAVPFFYHGDNSAYTLLFPIRDIEENNEVTIDYVEGSGHDNEKFRKALLVPWTGDSFADEEITQIEPDESYFLSGARNENVPDVIVSMPTLRSPVLKVYSEYSRVAEFLTAPGFVIVDNEEEADILWLTRHFSDYARLNASQPGTFINQFPFERVLTTKDLLSVVCRRGGAPKWLPLTYNLVTELPEFVGCYQQRQSSNLDNHWICKPWNLARAIDTTVTNDLAYILRLPFTGPKIAQKYSENPVLFLRDGIGKVKFDLRYVVLLESVEPLKVYAFKKFFLRFANKTFDLSDLWDYEKHFTVMNYQEDSTLYRMLCDEFVDAFEAQNPHVMWDDVERSLLSVLKEAISRGCSAPPPRGLAHFPQSRALYAFDLLLQWNGDEIEPLLLEINFGPDCNRACEYYPQFYNSIFNLLFRNLLDLNEFHVL